MVEQQDVALQMLVSGFSADPSSSWLIITFSVPPKAAGSRCPWLSLG